MTKFSAVVATIGAIALVPYAFSAEVTDSKTFIKEAIEGNLGEVAVGKLAQQKGSSEQVKTFGAMLIKDHGAANEKAAQAASSLGVRPPTEPGSEQKKVSDELTKLSGSQLDKRFSEVMVGDHEKDIAAYEKATMFNDAAGNYAKQTLPTLKMHLDHARQVRGPRPGSPAN